MRSTLSYFYLAVVLVAVAWVLGNYVMGEKPKNAKTATYAKKNPSTQDGKSKKEIKATKKKDDSKKKEDAEKADSTKRDKVSGATAVQTKRTIPNSEISDKDYFKSLKNSYLGPIVAALPEGRSREDVVIRYYKHNKDKDKVYVLKKLGYYLHEKEAEDSKNFGSNVLYYGSDVDVKDIQIVAYTLLQNGVPLKGIEPSQYEWKFHALEIGADSLLASRSELDISDVRNFSLD